MNQAAELAKRTRELVKKGAVPLNQGLSSALDELFEIKRPVAPEIELVAEALHELTGLGVLQPYLDDPTIEEIWINKPDQLHYWGHSGYKCVSLILTAETIKNLVHRMLKNSSRRIDRSWPFVDAALADGSRLHVVIPEATREHWAINIRKFRPGNTLLSDLEELGTISASQRIQLENAMREQKSILIAGATQAGKTTLMSALLAELRPEERLVSAEDTFELSLQHSDWVAMQTRSGNSEGLAEISLRELVKQSLRMRPSRIAIGEVRGAESLDMLIALNSGIPGICTIHANSAAAALRKLLTLPLLAGENITEGFLRPTIIGAFQIAVHCKREANGQRKVTEILEVTSEAL